MNESENESGMEWESFSFYDTLQAISQCLSQSVCVYLCVCEAHLATLDKQNIIITAKLSPTYQKHAKPCTTMPKTHEDNDNDDAPAQIM